MRAVFITIAAVLLGCLSTGAVAADLFGVWLTGSGNAHIELYRCADAKQGELCGRIVWLKQAINPDQTPAASVEDVHDVNNSDPNLRPRKLLHLDLMSDFRADPDNPGAYIDGHIYDPERGETYRAKIALKDDDTLILRGFVLMPMLGKSQVWTRVK